MKSADRLLKILAYISNSEKAISPKELELKLDIPISSVYRALNTLIQWEYVTHSHILGFYTLGAQSLKGIDLYRKHAFITPAVKHILTLLMEKSNESAAILVSDLTKSICVEMIESKQALRCSFVPGKGDILIAGASGKTLLAFYDKEIQEKIIRQYFPENTSLEKLQEKEKLLIQLEDIKTRGYGRSIGEIDEGVLGISAPIFRQKELIAVVTLMAPYFRSAQKEQVFITDVIDTAQNMTDLINNV